MSIFNVQKQEAAMTWNIATAKQQFSEVVRLTAEEPQAIYNRDKPVAVMVSAETFEQFKQWQAQRKRPTLAQQFDELLVRFVHDGKVQRQRIGPAQWGCRHRSSPVIKRGPPGEGLQTTQRVPAAA